MLNLAKGYKIYEPERLNEEYEVTDDVTLMANVDVEKIKEVFQHFIVMHDEPLFFILELPVTCDRENPVAPGILEETHKDVYYIDGCSQEECLVLLERYGELLINDGMNRFGYGCHESQDEIMLDKYNVITIYSQQLSNYSDFFEAHGIKKVESLITAWDTFSDETPGQAERCDYKGKSVYDLPEELKDRHSKAVKEAEKELAEEIEFYRFQQYCFTTQWRKLKAYANKKDISIIGDVPIYVALDSSDAWANPEMLQFDEDYDPKAVAGCPPDAFSATGQLWGNPLYAWDYHKKTGYDWWMKRVACCFKLYDIIRIDHFRGFDEYYAIPYGDETAENGKWMPGPGMDLFRKMKETLGDLPIIAEDLGFLTDTVRQLLKDSGYPGMKVLEFAFVAGEDSDYLPHNYDKNCVVYTGTHDNDTLQGWYQTLSEEDKEMTKEYLNNPYTPDEEVHWDFISLAMRSVADTCIIPVQDYLGLGNKARINMPSTLGGNWMWRMKKGAFTDELIKKIRKTTEVCAR